MRRTSEQILADKLRALARDRSNADGSYASCDLRVRGGTGGLLIEDKMDGSVLLMLSREEMDDMNTCILHDEEGQPYWIFDLSDRLMRR